ncbi:MAG: Serine-protein kinase RsbW, partial [uncultured Nocardioides sp.]
GLHTAGPADDPARRSSGWGRARPRRAPAPRRGRLRHDRADDRGRSGRPAGLHHRRDRGPEDRHRRGVRPGHAAGGPRVRPGLPVPPRSRLDDRRAGDRRDRRAGRRPRQLRVAGPRDPGGGRRRGLERRAFPDPVHHEVAGRCGDDGCRTL